MRGPFGDKKIEKKSQSAKKIQRGRVKIEYTKGGTLCTNLHAFPLAGAIV